MAALAHQGLEPHDDEGVAELTRRTGTSSGVALAGLALIAALAGCSDDGDPGPSAGPASSPPSSPSSTQIPTATPSPTAAPPLTGAQARTNDLRVCGALDSVTADVTKAVADAAADRITSSQASTTIDQRLDELKEVASGAQDRPLLTAAFLLGDAAADVAEALRADEGVAASTTALRSSKSTVDRLCKGIDDATL